MFGTQQQQQTGSLFGQQQPTLFGTQQPQQQQGLFGQQQQQTGIFGQQQQNTGLFGQQQPQQQMGGLFLNQNQQQQQQQNIPFQQYLPQGYIKQNIKNDSEMIEDLKKKRDRLNGMFDEASQVHQKQQFQQQFGQQIVEKCKIIQTDNLQSEWKQLLTQQKEVTKKVEEFLQTLGIIERQSEDGLNTIRVEFNNYKELSNAEQILKTQTQKIQCQYSQYDYGETSMFTVPQKYQEFMIEKPVKELYQIADVITKLEQIFLKMKEEPQNISDSDTLVDQHLETKLNQMTVLTNYLFLVIQRIKNIQGRVENYRQKWFSQLYPEKNRQIKDYHSIDLSKNQLESILNNIE